MIRIFVISIMFMGFLTFYAYWTISNNLKTQINEVSFLVTSEKQKLRNPVSLKLAVVGDTHTPNTEDGYDELKALLKEIKTHEPDLLLFVGDYTANPKSILDMNQHRIKLARILSQYNSSPSAFILGNYETWSDYEAWIREFQLNHAIILDNDVIILKLDKDTICLRGLGDFFTKKFKYIEFPKECIDLPQITITHDPAGGFAPDFEGLLIAGHTHCGQVSFPFIGPLWIPSQVPKEAHCGLYQDKNRTIFTTSGVGTSIYPIRFGTQSNWDLLEILFR